MWKVNRLIPSKYYGKPIFNIEIYIQIKFSLKYEGIISIFKIYNDSEYLTQLRKLFRFFQHIIDLISMTFLNVDYITITYIFIFYVFAEFWYTFTPLQYYFLYTLLFKHSHFYVLNMSLSHKWVSNPLGFVSL